MDPTKPEEMPARPTSTYAMRLIREEPPLEAREAEAIKQPRTVRMYGYTFARKGVLFRYQLTDDANLVTDSKTGERFRFKPDRPFEVGVAGDFTGWRPLKMEQVPGQPPHFELPIDKAKLRPGDDHQFKFVIDGHLWVEPPARAGNVVDASTTDPATRNLVLSFERENEPGTERRIPLDIRVPGY